MPISRRELLRHTGLGCFVLVAGPLMPASAKALAEADPRGKAAFPHGVASADPQPDRVLLWTRLSPTQFSGPSALLVLQVSPDPSFEQVLVERWLAVTAAQDFTLRSIVTGLQPSTDYYYRFFTKDGIASRVGRTWTAPEDDDERSVSVAFVSCQGFPPIQYGVYRNLMQAEASGRSKRPDFVLHLGDYAYGIPPEATPREQNRDAQGNQVSGAYAQLLENYRRRYQAYLKDDDLQDARAMYPFVCVWDDHEFFNDPWATYAPGEGALAQQRLAASQAWFEWVPQILSESRDLAGAANEAHDFRPAEVRDTPMSDFGDGFMSFEPNNFAALQALRTYRGMRWGAMVDIVLTDNRLYRGPGANPGYAPETIMSGEGAARAFSGFTLFDGGLLDALSRGREANDGNPPEELTISGEQVPNPRRDAPAVSMLGTRQKDWFKRALSASRARWKLWANATPIMAFKFDPGALKPEHGIGYLWTDGWDGFPNEREELMSYILENRISNLVSLSGDRHAHYAGLVATNHEDSDPKYVMPDFTCAAVSAFVRGPFLARYLRRMRLAHLASIEVTAADGSTKEVSTLNYWMRKGAVATDILVKTGDLEKADAAGSQSPNPHLAYADNDVHGYCLAYFDKHAMQCDFVSVVRPLWDPESFPDGPETLRIVRFRVPAWEGGETPRLERLPTIGEIPFGDVI